MADVERVPYDEFGLFHENAAEHGLPFGESPVVRREFVTLDDGRQVSALCWGDDEPELVLLHGGAQNAHTWDTVALALRHRSLIAIDLPGHGHSDGPGAMARAGGAVTGAALDVSVAVRELAPDAHGVVGMSFGGLTAIALTEVVPQLVRKVALVDIVPGIERDNAQHIVDFVAGPPTFPSFDELLERTMQFNPHRSESSLRRGILHNALQLEDGSWVWRHSRWRLVEHDDGAGTAFSEAAEGSEPVAEDHVATLAAIDVPVLLARGLRDDSVLRDEDEARLLEHQPGARVVHFPTAGHSIQGDEPVDLAQTLDDFI